MHIFAICSTLLFLIVALDLHGSQVCWTPQKKKLEKSDPTLDLRIHRIVAPMSIALLWE